MIEQAWVSIFGNAHIDEGTITHRPVLALPDAKEAPLAESSPTQPSHSIVRSNLEFEQGSISWEVKLGDPSCRAQIMLTLDGGTVSILDPAIGESVHPELAVGLNVLGAPYGFGVWTGKWEPAGGAGHGSTLPVNEWIPLHLSVRGSVLELYVRGVRVVTTNRTLKKGPISVLLQGNKECSIRNVSISGDAPICFAVMQFTEEFNVLYQDVIQPVCESYGYEVVRGDDVYSSGQILDDVTNLIRRAALIIADVTPDNANVFYEVGFAHAIGKPTILLSDRRRERLPFDISGFRTLFYDNTIGGKTLVEERLRQHLEALRPQGPVHYSALASSSLGLSGR